MKQITEQFKIVGTTLSVERYGEGHINDTFLVITDQAKYIMQKINHNIFTDIKGLMNNIVKVTEYVQNALDKLGDTFKTTLTVIKTKDDKPYLEYQGGFYRMYNFIDGAVSLQVVENPHQFYLSGVGFGNFQKLLDGFNAKELVEPIKNFHHTRSRFENFAQAIKDNLAGRKDECLDEINFYLEREKYCDTVISLLERKEIPYRVTHNDTKLNNVLIDIERDIPKAVIDLDTVMPGSILYDFGDSIRFGTNTGREDEQDLSKVRFSLEYFDAYAEGFLGEVGESLNKKEIELLAFCGILMTYECGMRFLTDHLNGDTYFKVHRENHNLDRTRTQIKLIQEMEKQQNEMNKVIAKYVK